MFELIVTGVPLLLAVIFHEISHGYVAKWNGDSTAARLGRLTLNPIPHIDPVGTILLPGLLYASGAPIFGWAKPVPVNFAALDDPRTDMIKVAVAGPAMNILLALVFAAIFHLSGGFGPDSGIPTLFALRSVEINVLLAVLNLTPLLPLDGGRILVGLLPRRQAVVFARMEPFGLMIVMGLLVTGMLGRVLLPIGNFVIHALL